MRIRLRVKSPNGDARPTIDIGHMTIVIGLSQVFRMQFSELRTHLPSLKGQIPRQKDNDHEVRLATMKLSEDASKRIWDNPDDAAYDQL